MNVVKPMLMTVFIFLTGCATIVTGTTQEVSFNTVPPGARLSINGEEYGKTPRVIRLDSDRDHAVLLELDGYQPYSITLEHNVSGWVWGNIIFGGLIGLVIDAASGGMYKLTPEQLNVQIQNGEMQVSENIDGMVIGVVMQADPEWEKVGQLVATR